jgi:hypothetical protein
MTEHFHPRRRAKEPGFGAPAVTFRCAELHILFPNPWSLVNRVLVSKKSTPRES